MGAVGLCPFSRVIEPAGLDLLGTVIVGTVTAVGGGTVRDALVMNRAPFWIEEWEYLLLGLAGSLAAFLSWPTCVQRL